MQNSDISKMYLSIKVAYLTFPVAKIELFAHIIKNTQGLDITNALSKYVLQKVE